MGCGRDAHFSRRISQESSIEVIGGSDKYVAMCRRCFHVPDQNDVSQVENLHHKNMQPATAGVRQSLQQQQQQQQQHPQHEEEDEYMMDEEPITSSDD